MLRNTPTMHSSTNTFKSIHREMNSYSNSIKISHYRDNNEYILQRNCNIFSKRICFRKNASIIQYILSASNANTNTEIKERKKLKTVTALDAEYIQSCTDWCPMYYRTNISINQILLQKKTNTKIHIF